MLFYDVCGILIGVVVGVWLCVVTASAGRGCGSRCECKMYTKLLHSNGNERNGASRRGDAWGRRWRIACSQPSLSGDGGRKGHPPVASAKTAHARRRLRRFGTDLRAAIVARPFRENRPMSPWRQYLRLRIGVPNVPKRLSLAWSGWGRVQDGCEWPLCRAEAANWRQLGPDPPCPRVPVEGDRR